MQRCVDTMYILGVSQYTTMKETAHTKENWITTGGEKLERKVHSDDVQILVLPFLAVRF